MEYHSTQWGWFALPLLVIFVVVMVPIALDDETSTVLGGVIAVFMLGLLALVLHFSRLRVTVGNGRVEAAFGSGWPRRVVELSEVTAVRAVRSPWWYGWGVRRVPNGWMYNVWGLDAVELELESGTVFRIGTGEPDELAAVLALHVRK